MTGNDIRYKVRTVKLNLMKSEMEKDTKTRIQYASKYASCANYWKYSHEQNKALKQLNTLGNKEAIEKEFGEWVNADASRKARYGEVLANLEKSYGEMAKYMNVQSYLVEALRGTETPALAYRVNRMVEKWCDKETSAEDKAKILEDLKKAGTDFYKNFNPVVEEKLYAALYKMYNDNVDAEFHPEIINLINKKYKGNYARFAADVRNKSVFMDEQRFNAFVRNPDCKKLKNDLALVAGRSFYEVAFKHVKLRIFRSLVSNTTVFPMCPMAIQLPPSLLLRPSLKLRSSFRGRVASEELFQRLRPGVFRFRLKKL